MSARRRMSVRLVLAAVLAALLAASAARAAEEPAPAAAPPEVCPRALHTGPDGARVACLEANAPVQIKERVPGWIRVQIEGWLRESETSSLATAPGKASIAGSVTGASGAPAPGALVRLLPASADLDGELSSLRQRHQTERAAIDRRLQEVSKALDRALFSSDNLTQANETRRELRDEKSDLEQQRQALRRRSLEEASALFERRQLLSAAGDASGFFVLEGVAPGAYRLLVATGPPGEAPAWYLPMTLGAGERRRIDLSPLETREDPFTAFN